MDAKFLGKFSINILHWYCVYYVDRDAFQTKKLDKRKNDFSFIGNHVFTIFGHCLHRNWFRPDLIQLESFTIEICDRKLLLDPAAIVSLRSIQLYGKGFTTNLLSGSTTSKKVWLIIVHGKKLSFGLICFWQQYFVHFVLSYKTLEWQWHQAKGVIFLYLDCYFVWIDRIFLIRPWK